MTSSTAIARIVVAATASGAGKTTATVALIAALRARGLRVAAFKCGPDYLDPTWHARASGVPSQNLDGWMMGRDAVLATFARASAGFDIAVIEGVMGLYDSAAPGTEEGSTAEIAKWLRAPVLLVVDAAGMARSVGALAMGYARFDSALHLAGLICNRVGSRGHLELLRAACREIQVVGALPRSAELAFPERHLGLFSADERSVPMHLIEAWGETASQWIDLDALLSIARSAPALEWQAGAMAEPRPARPRCRIGIAHDGAFHFYYEDNLSRLADLGAELVKFSPSGDVRLPEIDGLYLGGGYPELLARQLSENRAMIAAIREFAEASRPVYAECGGLMYLAEGIRTLDGTTWPMVGIVPGIAVMSERLQALGYVEAEMKTESMFGPAGIRFRGHQFRYSTLVNQGARAVDCIYRVRPRWRGAEFAEGYRVRNTVASYVHAHWASNPAMAAEFVRSCAHPSARRR